MQHSDQQGLQGVFFAYGVVINDSENASVLHSGLMVTVTVPGRGEILFAGQDSEMSRYDVEHSGWQQSDGTDLLEPWPLRMAAVKGSERQPGLSARLGLGGFCQLRASPWH